MQDWDIQVKRDWSSKEVRTLPEILFMHSIPTSEPGERMFQSSVGNGQPRKIVERSDLSFLRNLSQYCLVVAQALRTNSFRSAIC